MLPYTRWVEKIPAWECLPFGVYRLWAKPSPDTDNRHACYKEGGDRSHQCNAQLIGFQDLINLQHGTLRVHFQLLYLSRLTNFSKHKAYA